MPGQLTYSLLYIGISRLFAEANPDLPGLFETA